MAFWISELIPLLSISVTAQPAYTAAQNRRGEHLDPLTFDCSVQAKLKKMMQHRVNISEVRRLSKTLQYSITTKTDKSTFQMNGETDSVMSCQARFLALSQVKHQLVIASLSFCAPSIIGWKNSRLLVNQSGANKPKPIASWLHAFSRARYR